MKKQHLRGYAFFLSLLLLFNCIWSQPLIAEATEVIDETIPEDPEAEADLRKELPIQTNEIDGWPAGPEIGAEAAILMDADTGAILYAKNVHEKLFPASTTKMLTCLIALENCSLDDKVTFSYEAVHSVPTDGSNIGIDAGQYMTLEECLYGIMVGSANEVANAVGEHVSGSIEGFVELMNTRAAELGCTDSHFMNTNGLHDSNHYTSAYDLAMIANAFFSNEMLSKIGNTATYHFEPTEGQPDDFYKHNKHQLITGETPLAGVQGGKTGYTDQARQTLVTCAEQNGQKLICVILKEESPNQFNDTVDLFNYGFSNFSKVKVSDHETKYTINGLHFFQTGSDVFGSSEAFLTLDKNSTLSIPNSAEFSDLDSTVTYLEKDEKTGRIARIEYSFHGAPLGCSYIQLLKEGSASYSFRPIDAETTGRAEDTLVLINVKQIIFYLVGVGGIICLISYLIPLIRDFHFGDRLKKRKRKKRRKIKGYGEHKDVDF